MRILFKVSPRQQKETKKRVQDCKKQPQAGHFKQEAAFGAETSCLTI